MESNRIVKLGAALAIVSMVSGCAWDRMDRADKGTAVGGTGGAVAGAVVGGPVGAVVGAGVGAYVGNQAGGGDVSGQPRAAVSGPGYESALVRDVQQALNDKGYGAGPVDGQWGPATADAVRKFQQVMGLPVTGNLEPETLARLGVSTTRVSTRAPS